MKKSRLTVRDPAGQPQPIPVFRVHTLVIGSGAAGLNAAVQLRAHGVPDVAILTEGLEMGTSINTGSDKQTYYKLSLCGAETDSPRLLADTYFAGGSMHGDLALVEAGLSARAFLHLVNLGVPFPRDKYGQFVGYKTDHDPRQRATSIGPYTSREMCRALIRRVRELEIPVREQRNAVRLLTVTQDRRARAVGAVVLSGRSDFEVYLATNVVFAVGGPGGLYRTSVYPPVHTGAIGLGLLAGARAQSLPESQYGMASTKFRWNVSGTYMQVVPRFVSTAPDGAGEPREFLREYFRSPGEMNSHVFLKGYQWPFDSRKAVGGSSLVDILVYVESVLRGRRVFLDYRANPDGFRFEDLSEEAQTYLRKSKALQDTPLERLRAMNPAAIELYREHGIDLAAEPLEIAVCAQHNNGGLAANHWWESRNVAHLFPVGEVNGSHGVYRPGGSALNSGQVAGFRCAEFIANRYAADDLPVKLARKQAAAAVRDLLAWTGRCGSAGRNWQGERAELQERMTRFGAHIRSREKIGSALTDAWNQYRRLSETGCRYDDSEGPAEALRNVHLGFAHAAYLDAIAFALNSGVGSRGSALALDPRGQEVHDKLGDDWKMQPEDPSFREKVLETTVFPEGRAEHAWVPRRPLPESDAWFETAWASFRNGDIYAD